MARSGPDKDGVAFQKKTCSGEGRTDGLTACQRWVGASGCQALCRCPLVDQPALQW